MDQDNNCQHVWEDAGLWDGVDPKTSLKTGGKVYKCTKCQKNAHTSEQLLEMGGTYKNQTVSEYIEAEKKFIEEFQKKQSQ